jgi:hypothetical protein
MRVTGDDKSFAFAAWLRDRGIELTPGELSLVAGFVALAGARPVSAADIERGLELARDAAISDDAQLEQLGAHLLAFEAAHAQRAAGDGREPLDASPAADRAGGAPPAAVPEADLAAPGSPAPPVAPLKIMIRPTTRVPIIDEAAAPGRDDLEPASPHRTPSRLRRRALVAVGVAVVAATVAGSIYGRHSDGQGDAKPPAPPVRTSAPAAAQRLRKLDLGVRLPAGWREASDAELGTLPVRPDAAVVFRGATPSDPDHGVFVAAAVVLDNDLVAAARAAERGVIRQLGVDASAYHPGGCAIVELGAVRAGRCRGVAEHRAGKVAAEIYVRPVGGRNILALSLARWSQANADAEALAIVASFTP